MSEQRCQVSDLLVGSCAHCRPSPAREVTSDGLSDLTRVMGRPEGDVPVMLARYDGWCGCGCGEKVGAGLDMIVKLDGAWVLQDCL